MRTCANGMPSWWHVRQSLATGWRQELRWPWPNTHILHRRSHRRAPRTSTTKGVDSRSRPRSNSYGGHQRRKWRLLLIELRWPWLLTVPDLRPNTQSVASATKGGGSHSRSRSRSHRGHQRWLRLLLMQLWWQLLLIGPDLMPNTQSWASTTKGRGPRSGFCSRPRSRFWSSSRVALSG